MTTTTTTRPGITSAPAAHPVHPAHEHSARAAGAVGFAAIALIHVLDLPGKIHETPYLAVAYVALIVGTLAAAFLLLRGDTRRGWALGGALSLLTVVGYAVNRTVGMPLAHEDVGNWFEPLGLASLFVEVVMTMLAAWALSAAASGPGRRREVGRATPA
jgi:hypothetical protein